MTNRELEQKLKEEIQAQTPDVLEAVLKKSQKGSKRAFSQTQGVCHAAGRKNRQRRPIGLLFVLQGISGRVLE